VGEVGWKPSGALLGDDPGIDSGAGKTRAAVIGRLDDDGGFEPLGGECGSDSGRSRDTGGETEAESPEGAKRERVPSQCPEAHEPNGRVRAPNLEDGICVRQ
jgi:hypothetical protein